jgi:hypothetical protein
LLSIEPKISDLVHERPPTQLASQLERGRNQFRSAEVYVITREIAAWGIGVPENKQLRGFGNDVCGRLLHWGQTPLYQASICLVHGGSMSRIPTLS